MVNNFYEEVNKQRKPKPWVSCLTLIIFLAIIYLAGVLLIWQGREIIRHTKQKAEDIRAKISLPEQLPSVDNLKEKSENSLNSAKEKAQEYIDETQEEVINAVTNSVDSTVNSTLDSTTNKTKNSLNE